MEEQLDAILVAARDRWPEMVEHPYIVPVSKSVLEFGIGMVGGVYRYEKIVIEQIGPYRLGYGPQSKALCVGRT